MLRTSQVGDLGFTGFRALAPTFKHDIAQCTVELAAVCSGAPALLSWTGIGQDRPEQWQVSTESHSALLSETWLLFTCSGGELQRFAIAVVAAQEADVYMIDEPSSYLDVRQRLKAAQVRRSKKLRHTGQVFVFVSRQCCGRQGVMSAGTGPTIRQPAPEPDLRRLLFVRR